MKDQYVGDVSDYLKYALLRDWDRHGVRPGLAWMRTAADLRSDGGLTSYLGKPRQYRGLDPDLFDGLGELVSHGRRSIRAVVESGLVAHAFSHESVLGDHPDARKNWFDRLAEMSASADVLFLDPDNGLEVASVAHGKAGCRRYVFVDELRSLHRNDQAVCVYQHFPRVHRPSYVEGQLQRLAAAWPGDATFALCSPRIALLVSAPHTVAEVLWVAAEDLAGRDPGALRIWAHRGDG